ncbi:Hypothetical_protein [Hexamita inflata]|uniref:Hypothetical_protein n=1 Tax=Hexamita inflata TaxID=28002 RepID=A0AA86P0M4_9EUKA|nr:Hypothetical protein HINF_LOCUS17076 [Hexamita inflata]
MLYVESVLQISSLETTCRYMILLRDMLFWTDYFRRYTKHVGAALNLLDYPILYIIIIRVTRRPLIMRDLERRPDCCANEDRRISRAAGTYSMHSQVQSIVARSAV